MTSGFTLQPENRKACLHSRANLIILGECQRGEWTSHLDPTSRVDLTLTIFDCCRSVTMQRDVTVASSCLIDALCHFPSIWTAMRGYLFCVFGDIPSRHHVVLVSDVNSRPGCLRGSQSLLLSAVPSACWRARMDPSRPPSAALIFLETSFHGSKSR